MKEQQIVYQKYLGTHSGSDNIEMAIGARKVVYYEQNNESTGNDDEDY